MLHGGLSVPLTVVLELLAGLNFSAKLERELTCGEAIGDLGNCRNVGVKFLRHGFLISSEKNSCLFSYFFNLVLSAILTFLSENLIDFLLSRLLFGGGNVRSDDRDRDQQSPNIIAKSHNRKKIGCDI